MMKIFKKYWWKMEFPYLHRDIWKGIKNLIKWFPLVWKDADWDHSYIMYSLRFKIKNTADYIEKHKRYENWERDVERMRLCVRLFDALKQDIYELEYQEYYETVFEFEKTDEQKRTMKTNILRDDLDQYLAKYPSYVRRLKIVPENGNNISSALILGMTRHQKASDLLFELIKKNIYFWWD